MSAIGTAVQAGDMLVKLLKVADELGTIDTVKQTLGELFSREPALLRAIGPADSEDEAVDARIDAKLAALEARARGGA